MKIIREPQDVDFTVNGRELTPEEHQKISAYIQRQKAIRVKKSTRILTQQSRKRLV
jgi:hypothetical protein